MPVLWASSSDLLSLVQSALDDGGVAQGVTAFRGGTGPVPGGVTGEEQMNYTSLTASSPANPTNLTSVDSKEGFHTMMRPPRGGTFWSVPCPISLASKYPPAP